MNVRDSAVKHIIFSFVPIFTELLEEKINEYYKYYYRKHSA